MPWSAAPLWPDAMEKRFEDWCRAVTDCVRFRPDRSGIARELAAHYEDHVRDLERLGYDRPLAEERSLRAMGDPEEVGRAMDKAHKPLLGWLWEVSRGILLLAVIAALLIMTDGTALLGQVRNSLFPREDVGGYEMNIESYRLLNQQEGQEIWTEMGTLTAEGPVKMGTYTLALEKGSWWRYNDQFYRGWCLLRVETTWPWQEMPEDILDDLRMTDDLGCSLTNERQGGGINERKDFQEELWDHWFRVSEAYNHIPKRDEPDTYFAQSSRDLGGGWWLMQMTVEGEKAPTWTELTYPWAGNNWGLRIRWEVAP